MKNNKILSIAQRKSFFGSLFENKPRTKLEQSMVDADSAIREAALNHGSNNTSLAKDIALAKKAFENNDLLKVRDHLMDYNDGLYKIIDAFNQFQNLVSLKADILGRVIVSFNKKRLKKIAIFDFFKKKEVKFEDKYKHELADVKAEIYNLIMKAEENFKNIKNIFDILDKKRQESDVIGYVKVFINLEEDKKNFIENFETVNEVQFKPLFDMKLEYEQTGKAPETSRKLQHELSKTKQELSGKKDVLQEEKKEFEEARRVEREKRLEEQRKLEEERLKEEERLLRRKKLEKLLQLHDPQGKFTIFDKETYKGANGRIKLLKIILAINLNQ